MLLISIKNNHAGYNFTPDDIDDEAARTLTHHRVVDACKFAFAKRSNLGDGDFVDVTEVGSLHHRQHRKFAREAAVEWLASNFKFELKTSPPSRQSSNRRVVHAVA